MSFCRFSDGVISEQATKYEGVHRAVNHPIWNHSRRERLANIDYAKHKAPIQNKIQNKTY